MKKIKSILPLTKTGMAWWLATFMVLLLLADYAYYYQRIFPGVYLKDVHLANQTLQEADKTLDDLEVTFIGPLGNRETLSVKELGVQINQEKILREAFRKGRSRGWPFNFPERLKLAGGNQISLPYTIEEDRLDQAVNRLEKSFQKEEESAAFVVSEERLKLVPETPGYKVQKNELYLSLLSHLDKKEAPLQVHVPVEEISPRLTADYFEEKGITEKLASFSTGFDATFENRAHNIALGAAQMDQYLIPPGETFSFDAVVGDTTPQKGYKEAPVIRGGEYVPGYGGGICQVSSTLYNAALLSNLEILQRHHHRYMAPYITAGRDATVFYQVYDLKFKNNRDHHILIATRVEDGKITAAIAGTPEEKSVEIVTKEIEIIEPPRKEKITPELPPGEQEVIEGIPGGTIEAWRIVAYPDGSRTEEKLHTDNYLPYPKTVLIGADR